MYACLFKIMEAAKTFAWLSSQLAFTSHSDKCMGKEDAEQILDDLGSLSDPGHMAQTGSQCSFWLQPWTTLSLL